MTEQKKEDILFEVEHLKKYFPIQGKIGQEKKYVKAVDDVSFKIKKGECLGLVGESGCGKSTLIRSVMRLIEPTEGKVWFNGKTLTELSPKELKAERKNMQIIFQDPFASLHPKMRIGKIIEEPLIINGYGDKEKRRERVIEIMKQVGLSEGHMNRYPFEFSGGQRQRIVIARALALKPKLVILDEPVSALDVSIRSQILNLLEELQKEMELTYLFISHDLSVVEHICDSVMVMYLGHIMEMGTREQIFDDPRHPYTQALLSAIPSADPEKRRERIILQGEIPSPVDPPKGCVLKTRCQYCTGQCDQVPPMTDVGDGHMVSCFRC